MTQTPWKGNNVKHLARDTFEQPDGVWCPRQSKRLKPEVGPEGFKPEDRGEAKEYETVPSVFVADSDQCILKGWYSATNGDLSVNAEKLVDHSDSPIDLDLSTWKQANLK